MTTFFIPQEYPSMEALKNASYFDAVSDTSMDGIDVFGYVDGVAYAAVYENDAYDDVEYYVTAGDPLNQYAKQDGFCRHCGKTLSEYDGLCRWTDCVTNK